MSSEQFFSYIQNENNQKFKRHGTWNKERWWVGTDNFSSATGLLWTTHHAALMSCYTGFFNVRRGWQSLNTGPRFYLRLIRRTGWLWINTSRTTYGRPFKLKKLSVPFLYPGVPARLTPFRGLVPLGRRNRVPILPPAPRYFRTSLFFYRWRCYFRFGSMEFSTQANSWQKRPLRLHKW